MNHRSLRPARLTFFLGLSALCFAATLPGSPVAAQGPADHSPELPRLSAADLRAGLAALPAPQALPALLPAKDHQPVGPQQQPVDRLLEDFERGGWPGGAPAAPILTWLPTTLIDLWAAPGAGYFWATSACQAAAGTRSLCPICGGPQGAAHACGSRYPELTAGSVTMRLDLGAQQGLSELQLRLDSWADA